jgi:uncharacterized protein YwgA
MAVETALNERRLTMSEKIDQFCNNLRDKLTGVDDRIQGFKASVDSANANAKADIQSKLDKTRADFEAHKRKSDEALERIKANIEEKKNETKANIEEWKHSRETKKLEKRAQRAENYAADLAWLAMVSVEEAEYATFEAIAARIEADEVAEA